MNLSRSLLRPSIEPSTLVVRLLSASLAAGLAFVLAFFSFLVLTRLAYGGRALPGVRVGHVDVSGQTEPEIATTLGEKMTYPQSGRLVLRDADHVWTAAPAELGVVLDVPTMTAQALAVGRRGSLMERLGDQMQAWFRGRALSPIVLIDGRVASAYFARLSAEIDRPVVEASLSVDGLEVEVQPGQIGRHLDTTASLASVASAAASLRDASIDLAVVESSPQVLDVSQQAAQARAILSAPLTLTAEGAGPWTFEPRELAQMMRFNRVNDESGSRYVVGLDPVVLTEFLTGLAPDLERKPENARFIFNDDTRQLDLLQSAVIGRSLDIPAAVEAVNEGLARGTHDIPLVFVTTDPAVGDTATAEQLGITENILVASYGTQGATSYFAGSSPERVQNIKTASAVFHGLLIAPGQTFSMGDYLGDISLDTGYAEALIILGNRTIKGVGGGVCQVSTTLFRAAFYAGFPIVERHPHAYRVGYYEQGTGSPGPGLDATVFLPLVDFKFTNDTPYWLLMETYIYGNQLLWKFYSTSDGRTVEWSKDTSNKVDAPEAIYRENEDLPEGKIEQVDWEADGLDVVVYRTVTRNGEVLYEDRIKTHYLPWRAIYEFGPGTDLPDDANVEDKDD
ncbi:MAG TPA: VanW family protein [Anaerolineales bacterium]|nr:VanW family protein [Anaerolineales bacterium]